MGCLRSQEENPFSTVDIFSPKCSYRAQILAYYQQNFTMAYRQSSPFTPLSPVCPRWSKDPCKEPSRATQAAGLCVPQEEGY
jgi:hypothetical protein